MARRLERGIRSRFVLILKLWRTGWGDDTGNCTGPAHAVYFATYEAVKHAMGGNAGAHQEHHPLAAGTMFWVTSGNADLLTPPQPFPVLRQP